MVDFDNEEDTYFSSLPESEVAEALRPPAPWPAGRGYTATINEATKYQGEGKEYPCVMVSCTVANAEGKTKKMRSWILSKNPKATAFAVQTLRALGLKTTDYRNVAQLVGLSGEVELDINGDFNNIRKFVYKRQ